MMGWTIKLKAFESVIQLSLSIIQESKISLIDWTPSTVVSH